MQALAAEFPGCCRTIPLLFRPTFPSRGGCSLVSAACEDFEKRNVN